MSESGKRPILNGETKSSGNNPVDLALRGDPSEKSNKNTKVPSKKTKQYAFAPTNTIGKKKADGPGVLKSISVSQVRNTAPARKRPSKETSKQDYIGSGIHTPNSKKPYNPNHIKRLKYAHSLKDQNTNKVQNTLGESSPTEEVVWQYDPDDKSSFNKTVSTVDMSDDIDVIDNSLRNPPSTPLFNNRLRGILDFNNMSEVNKTEQKEKIDCTEKEMLPSIHVLAPLNIENLAENGRDIDDILKDVNGNSSIKYKSSPIKSQQYKDIPSSPVMANDDIAEKQPVEKNEKLNDFKTTDSQTGNSNSKQRNTSIDSSDDDLLIEILTQKSQSRTTTLSKKMDFNPQQGSMVVTQNKMESTKSLDELLSSDPLDDLLLEELGEQTKPTKPILATTQLLKTDDTLNSNKNLIDTYKKRAQCSNIRPGVTRLVVLTITSMNIRNIGEQKLLNCINGDGESDTVILRSPWIFLDINEGDVIHFIKGKSSNNPKGPKLLSSMKDPKTGVPNGNLLVLHPDLLLSATTIGSTLRCPRCSAIQLLFKDTRGDVSLPMTIGNIVHELLQNCLKYIITHDTLTKQFMEQKLDELLEVYSFAIIVCDATIDYVREEIIKTHLSHILNFINKFVSKNNYGRHVSVSGTRRTDPISITNIIDIEENIWSPSYGFKGLLDATVTARNEATNHLVPFEVKTGKLRSVAHEAQGLIYTLLLQDRYDVAADFFLLYYTRDPAMTKYPYSLQSMTDIMMMRNKIATLLQYRLNQIYTPDVTSLVIPSLTECRYCQKCQARVESIVLDALLGDYTTLDNANVSDYKELTKHLKVNLTNNRNFFKKYNDLITKEESSTTCRNQELFLKDSVTRETEDGLALSHLVISNFSPDAVLEEYFLYSFIRHASHSEFPLLTHSQIYMNDSVFISDEGGNFALAQGNVVEISDSVVVIRTKRQLLTNRQNLPGNSQDLTNSVRSVIIPVTNLSQVIQSQNVVMYRIDKNNIQHDMSTSRFNVLNIFLPPMIPGLNLEIGNTSKTRISKISDGGDEKMRKILVDNIKPSYVPSDQLPNVVYDKGRLSGFNENQVKAIDQALRCNDYSLILGMPGTGKTTVIAELIKILAANGKSVLLTSYTHSAVDNILLKLLDSGINMARLGYRSKINPHTQKFMPKYDEIKSYGKFIQMIDEFSVVATTCLGIKDIMFSLRSKDFDYVILDEASQVSLPVALGPLRYGQRFIMVGDHFQLPPLVKNDVAREHGLEESLFKILSERHPESMVELTYQYRMCGDIVKLSNFLIYEGRLKCGTEEVYNQKLKMLDPRETLQQFKRPGFENDHWLSDVLNPDEKVVFIDYDKVSLIIETSDGDNITNMGEAELIKLCLKGMLECGVACEDIGVMSLYRAQLRLLKRKLSVHESNGLEILTADQFQGRDKKCIIISMVRCNAELHGGALLKELRRVNVAMTRAKSKLIIVGSKKTIGSVAEIQGFMKMLEENKWMYTLPHNALDVYELAETKVPNEEL